MVDGRHFEKKPVKSPYLCNRLTDFDKIWYNNNNNNDRLTAFDPGQPG